MPLPKRTIPGSLAVLAIISLLLLGCCGDCFQISETKEPPPYYDGLRYFPLRTGNYWKYSTNGDRDKTVQIIVGDTLIWYDRTLYEINTFSDSVLPEFSTFSELVWMESDSLLQTNQNQFLMLRLMETLPTTPIRILNPLRVGDSLTVQPQTVYTHSPNWGYYNWVVVTDDTTITTEYGDFDKCMQLRFWFHWIIDGNDYVLADEFYAPDTGLVQFKEYPFDLNPGDLGDSLIVYNIYSLRVVGE
jgi:hypothetical protein